MKKPTKREIEALALRNQRLLHGFPIYFETDFDLDEPNTGPSYLSVFVDVAELSRIENKLTAMRMFELTLAQCAAVPYRNCPRKSGQVGDVTDFGYTLRDGAFCLTVQFGDGEEELDTAELPMRMLSNILEASGMAEASGSVGWLGESLLVSASPPSFGAFAAHMLRSSPAIREQDIDRSVRKLIQRAEKAIAR